MQKKQKRLMIGIVSVVSCLLICLVLGLVLNNQHLEELQHKMLQKLEQDIGKYDEQSIVLYNTSNVRARKLAEKTGAQLRMTANGCFAKLTLPTGVTIRDIFANNDNLEYLEEMSADYEVQVSEIEDSESILSPIVSRPQYSVSDENYELQTYLDYLNMQGAWYSTTGKDVTVAVIDTGIDTDHPEFAGRISEYSYNATTDQIVKDWILEDGSYDWSLIEDEQGHGTSVTGVLAASMNNDKVVGIAPDVEIIVIKAECDEKGTFKRTSDLVFGLYYAVERDVDLVNMSFGTYDSSNPFASAIQLAYDSDIICVAAAGNEGLAIPCYPAADEKVIGVGALKADSWELASYSNYGENVDLVAPGTVYTTKKDGSYGSVNGTSVASPVVCGALALQTSMQRYQEFTDVTELLYASCYDLGDLGPDWYFGYGALDVNALLLEERGTITFNMMTEELENTTQLFIRNHTLQSIPEPERLYAVFDGWYYDPQCTEEFQYYSDVFSSDLTLYANWANEEDGVPYTYVELDDGTIEIRSYTGHRRYITIPDKIEGKIVSSIGEGAFQGNTRLREVNLPRYLVRIRRAAFSQCSNLLHIDIPDTVKEIGDIAFCDNIRMSYVALEESSQLQTIGSMSFAGCANLVQFQIPMHVTTITSDAFYGCTQMEAFTVYDGNTAYSTADGVLFNITKSELVCYPAGHSSNTWENGVYIVPSSVRNIANYAFAFSKVTAIDLASVEYIGEFAFMQASLESVTIPDSVTIMQKNAFANASLCAVTLGTGLTDISNGAFAGCLMLTSVEIPSDIQTIGEGAFSGTGLQEVFFAQDSKLYEIKNSAFFNTEITSITIPASVIRIGDAAFSASCYSLIADVTFDENSNLQVLGNNVFANAVNMKEIELPQSLREIGTYAFYYSGLSNVVLPENVSFLGAGAFASCHSLQSITVEKGNTAYYDLNGIVFTTDGTTLVAYPAGAGMTEYEIPETVITVGASSFEGSWNLQQVSVPESVHTISEYAFYECVNMHQYQLAEGLESVMACAFSRNYTLENMDIPDSVILISRYVFSEDYALTSVNFKDSAQISRLGYGIFAFSGLINFRVPSNISTIAQGTFTGCDSLMSVTFAENSKLENISAFMFEGCSSLESVIFESGSALTSIQAHAFEGMRKLTTIDFGDAKISNIDNFAFRFCESLTEMQVPDGTSYLGRYAFYYCINLQKVTIPASMERIGRFAFIGTENINVYFSANTLPLYLEEDWDYGITGYYLGVKDIIDTEEWTYAQMTDGNIGIIQYKGTATSVDLTKLEFGGNIVSIGGEAFAYSTVNTVILPDTLVTIQAKAFYQTQLQSISIPASVTFIGRSAFADTPIETATIAEGTMLRVIEQSAFENTESLQAIELPASLETMGRSTFKNSGIQSVSFAQGFQMTEIPQEAFAYSDLTAVEIPDSITVINHNAFCKTEALESVTFGTGDALMIMSNAFYQSGLKTVEIPENVSYIGEYAFIALKNLTEFKVDAENPYYTTIDGLLTEKDSRKLIAVPAGRTGSLQVPESIEEIGFGAFEESQLSEITFSADANILSFGFRAFYGAKNITEMHIPASVVAIDYYAFANCTALKTVTFADENLLRGVYEGAFYGCKNLCNITLPDSIVEISEFAFYGCAKLTDIPVSEASELLGIYDYGMAYTGLSGAFNLPATLLDVGDYAFCGNNITSITISDTNAKELIIGLGAFADCHGVTEMTVPFVGASMDPNSGGTWLGYLFGAGDYEANTIYVPDTLKKVTITEGVNFIGVGAFSNLKTLQEIQVPHSVDTLYPSSFLNTTAEYELTNSILTVDNGGIVTSAGSWHFGSGITGHLDLAEGIPGIGSSTFYDCSQLQSISIPNSVTSLDLATFMNCVSLRSVVLPKGITKIPIWAFHGCKNLTHVALPESLTTIETDAFELCTALTEITIPENVIEIQRGAFSGCDALYEVYNNSDLTFTIGTEYNGGVAKYAKKIVGKDGSSTYLDETTGFELIDTADGFRFMKENDTYQLIAYLGTADEVTLPTDVNGSSYTIAKLSGVRNLQISEGVTAIEDSAFAGTAIESVSIPYSVTEIEESAFAECDYLTEITIPGSVTTIGNNAFDSCDQLQSVILMDGITAIGERTFNGCYNIKNVFLPSTLKTIGTSAFEFCSSLSEIQIPDSVTSIGEGAFQYCYALENVVLPSGLTKLSNWTFESCGFSSIQIPDSVTEIGFFAFSNCDNLKEISVPDHVTEIYGGAFSCCDNLKTVRLPNGISYIAYLMFSDCVSLENVVIPDDVNWISSEAFKNCSSLKSIKIPEPVTWIDQEAFSGCTSLTEITIPANVVQISDGAFAGCAFEEFSIDTDNTAFTMLDGIVYDKEMTSIIYVPDSVTSVCIPKTVTDITAAFKDKVNLQTVTFEEETILSKIGWEAFYGCESLTSITIPSTITEIEYRAFYHCSALENIVIPGSVTALGSSAFQNCTQLKEIILPDSILTAADSAFRGCSNLKRAVLSSSITTIEGYLFAQCESLESVTGYGEITSIGYSAFCDCYNLQSFHVPKSVNSIQGWAFRNCQSMKQIVVPEGITVIEEYTFAECRNLRNIVLPNSVKTIERYAFCDCTGLVDVTLSEALTIIRPCAFGNCNALTSITLPPALIEIDEFAFGNCDLLFKVYNNSALSLEFDTDYNGGVAKYAKLIVNKDGNPSYKDESAGFTYVDTDDGFRFMKEDGVYSLICYMGTESTVTLPDDIDGHSYQLYKLRGVHNVIVPEGRRSIEEDAFEYSCNLESITFSDDIAVIGKGAFSNCSLLQAVNLSDSITSIGEGAFYGCSSLKNVHIPTSLTTLEYGIFGECTSLTAIIIPDNITHIMWNAFYRCTGLVDVKLSDNLVLIEGSAFSGCDSLQEVVIPSGVKEIGGYAFQDCSSLFDIVIPDGVDYIGQNVILGTQYYNDENNWDENGCLYVGNYLMDVKENTTFLAVPAHTCAISVGAFAEQYKLTYLSLGGSHEGIGYDLTNLETLVITEMPTHSILQYFSGYLPKTLKSIVLQDGVQMHMNAFEYITGVTIYVEASEKDVRWDENFPGWNNGNKVVYGDKWISAEFYQADGMLLSKEYFQTSQVIRQPYLEVPEDDEYTYEIIGWDLDGDGVVDSVPATSTTDISARPIIVAHAREYTVTFYDKDGVTPLYTYTLPYGSVISEPEAPTKKGYTFLNWIGYTNKMTVTGDMNFYSDWAHDGEGHEWCEPVWQEPTCKDRGYYKHTCTICDEWYGTDFTPEKEHNYSKQHHAPTCTEMGYDEWKCEDCGDSYCENFKQANGHEWGEWIEDEAPDCHNHGKHHRNCKNCSFRESQDIPVRGHDYASDRVNDSTCETEGKIHYTCKYCADEVIEKIGCRSHRYHKQQANYIWFEHFAQNADNLFYSYEGNIPYYYECEDCHHIRMADEATPSADVAVKEVCDHILGEEEILYLGSGGSSGIIGQRCTLCETIMTARACGAGSEIFEEMPEFKFSGASLTLYDNLQVSYKVNKNLFEKVGYVEPYVQFVFGNETYLVTDYIVSGNYYVFDFSNIAPHQINDTIYATLCATYKGILYETSAEYSVATYCYNMLKKYNTDEYAELRTLLVDLLNYGTKTQIYMGYKTDNLANANLSEEQVAWGTSAERTLVSVQNTQYETIDSPSVLWKGAGLNLQDSIAMRFKIAAENIDKLQIKVTSAEREWYIPATAFERIEEGSYYVYFDGLDASQMSEAVYLTVYEGEKAVSHTICYSVESYACAKQNDIDTNLAELVRAMMNYGDSAYAYVV